MEDEIDKEEGMRYKKASKKIKDKGVLPGDGMGAFFVFRLQ